MGIVIGKPLAQPGSLGVDTSELRGAILPANKQPAIVSTSPGGTDGIAYAFQYHSIGGRKPIVWDISAGTLPTGLLLDADGLLSGTPSAPGTFDFTVRATDNTGRVATLVQSVTIA